jgi:alkylation response protein AidB-like acyl-CoA dehydrogenase
MELTAFAFKIKDGVARITPLRTRAVRNGDHYVLNGQKHSFPAPATSATSIL